MRTLYNVVWGLLAAAWVAASISAVCIVIALANSEARSDLDEIGGLFMLLLGYATAAVVCGITVGLLRPFTHDEDYAQVVGGILHVEAFAAFLTVMGGFKLWGSLFVILMMILIPFVIGFFMTPLWQRSFAKYLPNFDRWLDGLILTSDLGERKPDDDGAA